MTGKRQLLEQRQKMINRALIYALLAFGVLMLIIGLLFGVGYWTADSPAARYLLLGAGLGGSGYIFAFTYRALRKAR